MMMSREEILKRKEGREGRNIDEYNHPSFFFKKKVVLLLFLKYSKN
jgi:hypothetical protein